MRSCASRPGNGPDKRRRRASGSDGIASIVTIQQAGPKGPTLHVIQMKRRLWNRRAFVATSAAGGLGALTIGPWGFNFLMDRAAEIGREVPAAAHTPSPAAWSDNAVTLAWLGHATVLINFFGVRILTDPILYPRIGVDLGSGRWDRCAWCSAPDTDELPDIDLVLVSHAHFDHLDTPVAWRGPRQTRRGHGAGDVGPPAESPLFVGQRTSLERSRAHRHGSRSRRSCARSR